MITIEILNNKLASFIYNDEEQILIPTQMENVGDGIYRAFYEKGLMVELRFTSVVENVYEWVVRFENTSDENTYQITSAKGLDIEPDNAIYEKVIWRSIQGDWCNYDSFMPIDKNITSGETFRFEAAFGRSSQNSSFPYFDLEYGDKSLVCGIGWSGQWQAVITRQNRTTRIIAGQQDCDFYLLPGESARANSVLILFGGNDVEKSRQDFRRIHREYYSPAAYPGGNVDMPISLQVFDRYYWKDIPHFASEDTQMKCLLGAIKLKYLNTFWIDATWFREGFPNGVGNFDFAPGFPDELINISKEVHNNGMRLMVWFEPERIHVGSDTNKQFGETKDFLLRYEKVYQDERLLNLGNPAAREWLLNVLSGIIKRNKIDIYRQDFNIDPLEFWRAADEEGRLGLTENKHIEGLYKLWDALLERFPGLLIDNCSSGGRRIDIETCRRSVPVWRSDTAVYPHSEEMPVAEWHQNQTINLSRYIPYHTASSWFESAYLFRSGCTMGIACGFDVLNENYDFDTGIEAIKEMEIIKPCWRGDFYPLTETVNDPSVWIGYQLHNLDFGCCLIFRRPKSEEDEMIFKLKGVDEDSNYKVIFHDENRVSSEHILAGRELTKGLIVNIPQKPASVLIEYCSIK